MILVVRTGELEPGVITNSESLAISCQGPVVRRRNEPFSTKFTECPFARSRSGSWWTTPGVWSKRLRATAFVRISGTNDSSTICSHIPHVAPPCGATFARNRKPPRRLPGRFWFWRQL